MLGVLLYLKMTDIELLERFKKDTELNLTEILTKANANSLEQKVICIPTCQSLLN